MFNLLGFWLHPEPWGDVSGLFECVILCSFVAARCLGRRAGMGEQESDGESREKLISETT